MRVGVLGGTFDPPHVGHLILAAEARWHLRLDEVRLMPAGLPPHKAGGAALGTARRRLDWARALAGTVPGATVADDEVLRDGPSYTADTMEAIARREPRAELWFLMGADQLEGLPGWHDPHRLLTVARLGVVPRAGHDAASIAALARRVAPGRVDVVPSPRVDVSSSLVRERIAAGAPVGHLVPPAVLRRLVADGVVPSDTGSH